MDLSDINDGVSIEEYEIDVDIDITDRTLSAYNLDFNKINKLILSEQPHSISKNWSLISDIIIYTDFSTIEMRVNFYSNRDVGITECVSDVADPQMATGIPLFIQLLKEKGWHLPIVSDMLAKSSRTFWKGFYLSGLVTGKYLEDNIIKNE